MTSRTEGAPVTAMAQRLRQTSDTLLGTLDELAELERTKRQLQPGDPATTDLSMRIAELAERVLSGTVAQLQLSEQAMAQVAAGSPQAPGASIAETPRTLSTILDEWRAAERRATESRPASAEWLVATADSERLREEYRRAFASLDGEAG
jgi:hypothetical protein